MPGGLWTLESGPCFFDCRAGSYGLWVQGSASGRTPKAQPKTPPNPAPCCGRHPSITHTSPPTHTPIHIFREPGNSLTRRGNRPKIDPASHPTQPVSTRGEAPTWSTGSLTGRASSRGPSPWAASPLNPRTGRLRVPQPRDPLSGFSLSLRVEALLSSLPAARPLPHHRI